MNAQTVQEIIGTTSSTTDDMPVIFAIWMVTRNIENAIEAIYAAPGSFRYMNQIAELFHNYDGKYNMNLLQALLILCYGDNQLTVDYIAQGEITQRNVLALKSKVTAFS